MLIAPITISDGPRKPWKRNKRGGGKLDWELIRLTHQLLDKLKVPHHRAPGEAEAECARMQALGIVDAVWSDDGDALMFGCGTLIRQHKEGGKIVKDHVRIYQADTIREKYDLDSDSLVLFALLAGGDYNTEGLRGCGSKTAAILARRENGLARALCHASERDLPVWRQRLQEVMRYHNKSLEAPRTFPDFKALGHYRHPTISSPEQLHNLRGLKHGWSRPIDQSELRVILRQRFNFTTREFMKHITPIFLTRALAGAKAEKCAANLSFGIELKRTRPKKDEDGGTKTKSEVKITFSPIPVVEIDLSTQPADEDWTQFAGKDGTPYDPRQDLECEVLECLLRLGLPDGTLDQLAESSKTAKRKRKARDDTLDTSPSSERREAISNVEARTSEDLTGASFGKNDLHQVSDTPAPKKRGRPPKNPEAGTHSQIPAKNKNKKPKATESPPQARESTPMSVFKYPKAIPPLLQSRPTAPNLSSGTSPPASSNARARPSRLESTSPPPLSWCIKKITESSNEKAPVPGKVMSREALRSLRAGSGLLCALPDTGSFKTSRSSSGGMPSATPKAPEVIDLT